MIQYRWDQDLDDPRDQLVRRFALVLLAAGLVSLGWVVLPWLNWPVIPFPGRAALPLAIVVGLACVCWVLARLMPALMRHVLAASLIGSVALGMWLRADPWLPFLALPVCFASAMLVPAGGFLTGAVAAAVAAWLTLSGARSYPLDPFLIALALCAVSSWQAASALFKLLDWTWSAQRRSAHLLEQARDRQAHLNSALRSLDITATSLSQAKQQLIAARNQAEAAWMLKERFAAKISHELRTPLSVILGFSEIMYLSSEVYGDMAWPPTLRQDVYQIYRNSRHLLAMIDDILDLSRFEVTGFSLNKELTPLEPLLREALDIVGDFFHDRPVALDLNVAANLPVLNIDRTRILQVLLNLLSNAARVTDKGMVQVTAQQADGEVLVRVTDTGPGIPPERQPQLFEEFRQVDQAHARGRGGAGLGLAICKRFVEAHDGRIWVESEQGVGTSFAFALPIPGQVPRSPGLLVGRSPTLDAQEMRPTVLLVDPDPSVGLLMRRRFDDYEVVQVEGAAQLPEAVERHQPLAVIVNKPPEELLAHREEVLDEEIAQSIPVFECSLPSQFWMARRLGAAACLSKPIRTDVLVREIYRAGDVHDILIADDDGGIAQLVERALQVEGRRFSVRQAFDGASALSAMQARRPDLLLLDLIMPTVDGFEVLQRMRSETALAGVPVIVLTGTTLDENAQRHAGRALTIRRTGGLTTSDTLSCLSALFSALRPRPFGDPDGRDTTA